MQEEVTIDDYKAHIRRMTLLRQIIGLIDEVKDLVSHRADFSQIDQRFARVRCIANEILKEPADAAAGTLSSAAEVQDLVRDLLKNFKLTDEVLLIEREPCS